MRDEIRNLFPADIKYVDALPLADYIEGLLQEKEKLEEETKRLNKIIELFNDDQKLLTCFMNNAGIEYAKTTMEEIMKCEAVYHIHRYADGLVELKRNEPFYLEEDK